jgi:hypothetical protein
LALVVAIAGLPADLRIGLGAARSGTAGTDPVNLWRIAILDGVPARQAVRYVREHYPPRGGDILPAALCDQVPRDQLTPVPRYLLLFEHGETRWQQRGRFPVTQAPPLRE